MVAAANYRDGNGRRNIYAPKDHMLKTIREYNGHDFEYVTHGHNIVGNHMAWETWQRYVDWKFEWDVQHYEFERAKEIAQGLRAHNSIREAPSGAGIYCRCTVCEGVLRRAKGGLYRRREAGGVAQRSDRLVRPR